MKRIFRLAFVLLLVFVITACGQTVQNDADTMESIETVPVSEDT